MAINLSTVGQGISYPGVSGTAYATELNGATELTVHADLFMGATISGTFILSKWLAAFTFGQSFTLFGEGGEIGLLVFDGAVYRARITTNTPVVINSRVNICARWTAAGVMAIAVNGVDCPIATWSGLNGSVTALQNAVSVSIQMGVLNLGGDAYVAAYQELGIWNADIGGTAALAITDPDAPEAVPTYTTNLFFYVPLCRDSVGTPLPDHYFKNLIDDVDAGTYTLDDYPTGTSTHQYVVYPNPSPYSAGFCPVVAVTEVEPGIGESFGPLVWVEWGGSDDVIRVWAPVDLPDPDTYYHGYKAPLLLVAGRVVRALSDEQGEYQGQTFDVTIDDTGRDLRTLLGAADDTRHLLNTRGVMRMISQADWRLKLKPRTVAIGQVRNYRLH